ncbi:MAG: Fur family transcriptional regulator [Pseudoclavibacter sp.]
MSVHVSIAPESWGEQLRESGLRVTAGRLATLQYLDEHPHSSAADIFAGLSDDMPSISAQSVHNIVHDLTRHELVRRIDLPDSGSARYETRTHDNHHHVQCVVCGHIEDVDCVVGHAPCLTPDDVHGMRVLTADITFRGVCPECEQKLRDHDPQY